MNKGIRLSTGDIIGILNSDDCLATTTTVSKIASSIDAETDGVYGDVNVISRRGGSKVIRTISSKRFKPYMIRFGIAPPHPSFYIRRESYCKIGGYKSDYKISADFDLIVRMIRGGIRLKRLEECIVTMRNGGTSARGIFFIVHMCFISLF